MERPKIENCPSCDERLVKMGKLIGALVCPNCDLVVLQTENTVDITLPPEAA